PGGYKPEALAKATSEAPRRPDNPSVNRASVFESTDAFIPISKTYFVGTMPHDQVVPRDDRIDHHAITDPGQAREAPRADPAAHDGGRRVWRRGGPREHPLPPHPRGQLQRPAGAPHAGL